MLKNNLIYLKLKDKYLGFLDTGGGYTFLFRKDIQINKIKCIDIGCEADLFPKNVVLFVGNDYWKNKIYLFDYMNKKFKFVDTIPKNKLSYQMYYKNKNFSLLKVIFNDKNKMFLFDTGAMTIRNGKNYGISFLDGNLFDNLDKKYKIIKNYDDDGSPCVIIPKIIIFGKIIRNVKFLRRNNNNFEKYMSTITGVKHVGAIGGNVLKYFTIYADFKNKKYWI